LSDPLTAAQKVIVITGATGVLGNKTAHAFAEHGHALALFGNHQNKLDALSDELNLPDERLFASIVNLQDGQSAQAAAEAVTAKFRLVRALILIVGGWAGGEGGDLGRRRGTQGKHWRAHRGHRQPTGAWPPHCPRL